MTFPGTLPLNGMEYTITAVASNEFGESPDSEAVEWAAPLKPVAPVIVYVDVPDQQREPYGPVAVVVTHEDSGIRELLRSPPLPANLLWARLHGPHASRLACAALPSLCLCSHPAVHGPGLGRGRQWRADQQD